ncbi:hypothetical protein ALC57_17935 [Trachymyrmex cornetzi]|uniref:Uncharacterized protein n=1 Tax=Trachymyrmex cornetzi TaxID=471704 RepID=A0A195DAM5_9HYME|nr:hypothetical protein ALC57_17935 [Trachymyrmex cornetzi]
MLFDPVKPSCMDLAVVQFPLLSEPIIGKARYRSRGIYANESGVPTSEQLINEANACMLTGPSISTPGASRVHSYVPERCASNTLTDTKRESESTDDILNYRDL